MRLCTNSGAQFFRVPVLMTLPACIIGSHLLLVCALFITGVELPVP